MIGDILFKHVFQLIYSLFALLFIFTINANASEELPTPHKVVTFDSLDGWTTSGSGTFSTVESVTEGDGAMTVVGNGKRYAYPRTKKNLDTSISGSDLGVIAFAVKKNLPRVTTNTYVRFGQGSSYSSVDYDLNVANLNAKLPLATYWIAYDASEDSSLSADKAIDSVLIQSPATSAPYSVNNTIDAIYTNAKGQPTVVVGFDDAENTIETIAYPYMQQYGMVGTIYLPTQMVGKSDSLTWDQVTTLSDAGWAISIDGSPWDSSMLRAGTVAKAVRNAVSQWDDLREHNLDSDAMYHLCYPNGTYFDVAITTIQVSQMTTNGTETVTFNKVYSISNGMYVYGTNIPEGTYVVSGGGDSVTSVKLSTSIPTQTLPAMFNDESGEFYLGKLPAALKEAGIKSARRTGGGDMYTRFGFGDREMSTLGQGVSNMTFKNFKPMIDQIITRGTTMETYFHRILPDPAEGWTENTKNPGINVYESFFKAYIDELYKRQTNGELVVLTKPEWYERDIDATAP